MSNLFKRYFVEPLEQERERDTRDKEELREIAEFVSNRECARLEDWLATSIRALEPSGPVEHGQSLFNSGVIRGLRMVQDRIANQRETIKERNHE